MSPLFDRALASSANRPEWLRSRKTGVTATEVAKLARGGPAFVQELLGVKLSEQLEPDLSHVRAIMHGRLREEVIAGWVSTRFTIAPNSLLFQSEGNPRHLATPDGIGSNFDEEIVVSEIKTSKHDLDPAGPDGAFGKFWDYGYWDQMQWQMYVCGARRCLFAWEQHDDDWSGWPERHPAALHAEPRHTWVERDEARIRALIEIADSFLVKLDAARGERRDELDQDTHRLIALVMQARQVEDDAKAQHALVRGLLAERLAQLGDISYSLPGLGKVSYTAPREEPITEPDPDAAREAYAETYLQFEQAQAEWEAVLASFTKPKIKTIPGRLTVTPMKGHNGRENGA